MRRSLFLEYFPTPVYLRMPALGIDASDRFVRYVELESSKNGLIVRRYGQKELPAGTVQGGEIAKRGELLAVLTDLREELGTRYIHAALPEEKAYLFATEIPRVDKREIRGAIELLLEENVPIKPNEAIFDYEIINVGARDHYDVSVSVLPEIVVHNHLSVYEEAGFEPLVMIVDAQAVTEAVIPQEDSQTFFVVNIGAGKTTLSIVGQGVVYFTSTVNIGGDTLTAAFQKQLGIDGPEAHRRKFAEGIIGAKQNMELFFSLMSSLSVLRDEMGRLTGYWQNLKRTRHNLPDLGEIIFAGSSAAIPGLTDYFSVVMKTPVRLANVWANTAPIETDLPELPFVESLDYASAIGLALPKTD